MKAASKSTIGTTSASATKIRATWKLSVPHATGGEVTRWNRNRQGRDPLSRDERAAYGVTAGFSPRQRHVICSSCRDNELSPPGVPDPWRRLGRFLGRRRDYRCEECGGYGLVEATIKQGIDQYLIPKKG